jgi:hypothetical protein
MAQDGFPDFHHFGRPPLNRLDHSLFPLFFGRHSSLSLPLIASFISVS